MKINSVYLATSIEEEQNILSASTNPAYGVTRGQESKKYIINKNKQ